MPRREIPRLEAMLRGFSPQEIEILQAALDYFDGSYEAFMAHLQELGASRSMYARVNGAIKRVMGKRRGDVDTFDYPEMMAWGDGYTESRETTAQLGDAVQRTVVAFEAALERWLREEEWT